MSNDPQETTGAGNDRDDRGGSIGSTIRRDGAKGLPPGGGAWSPGGRLGDSRARRWARLELGFGIALVLTMLIFAVIPLVNLFRGLPTKDYGLWYQVGLAERQGYDIYPRPESGRLFPFMYPPSAAAMLGMLSPLGQAGMILAMVVATSASWIACVLLSTWLAAGSFGRRHRHPLVLIVPTLSVIVLIHNTYLLGQPNLALLALLLGAFACIRLGRQVAAGALVATAAAIKAFPILVLGYLVYRRMWRASIATVAVLAAWLLIAPLPFRTPVQVVDDLSVWTRGMLFTYNSHGIAERTLRAYGYKNQSIMAVLHRFLRDVPADGEAVLSGKSHAPPGAVRPTKGLPPVDPSTDLLTFLKPHQRSSASTPVAEGAGSTAGDAGSRWDEDLRRAEPAFRTAWKVNVLSLEFRTVTAITLAAMLALGLFVLAVLPPRAGRTRETDAMEFALVTLLTVICSPLSFNYAYVWTMYPTALALHRVLGDPSDPSTPVRGRWRWLALGWLAAVLLIPALAIADTRGAQALGNLFVPALLLVFGLGWMLRAEGRVYRLVARAALRSHHGRADIASDPLNAAGGIGYHNVSK
jgi:alpha-1,2-mannosyltransferase